MNRIIGSGGGGKGGGGSPVVSIPAELTNLECKSIAEVIDLLCLGPIKDFVHPAENYAEIKHPYLDIYLDETPLMDNLGQSNFTGVTIYPRGGYDEQPPIPLTYSVETPVSVEQIVTNASPVTVSNIGAGLDWASCNAIIVKVQIPVLFRIGDDGSANKVEIGWQIHVRSSALGNWTQKYNRIINEMTGSPYEEDFIINDIWTLGPPPWDVKIIRVSPDYTQTAKYKDEIKFWSYSLASTTPYLLKNCAAVGWQIDAKQFGNRVPARAYHIYGYSEITIPSNYNPMTRAYTGVWDGTLTVGWTNNPAWVFYWLLWYNREQLGYDDTALETLKWQCYKIGQYCDGMVPVTLNGVATTEPRWTFNGVIQNQEEVFHLLNSFASTFCAVPFWASNCVMLAQDAPYDPAHPENVNATHIATAANVDSGWFSYVGSDIRNRYTVVRITWNDPNDMYRQAVEVVESKTGILRYGWNAKDVVRWGCTSRTEAIRYARWLLENELTQPEIVTFTGGLEFSDCYRGCIIEVQDPRYTVDNSGNPLRLAGRLLPVSRVLGTDGNKYRCKLSHTSAVANKPITGGSWSTYWELDDVDSGVPEWQEGWPCIKGPDATHVYLDGPVTLDAGTGFKLHIAIPRSDAEALDDLPDQMYRVIDVDIASGAGTYAVGTPIQVSTLAGYLSQEDMDSFLPGAIWCISSPNFDHGPRYFRCLTNIEKSPGKFQISGCYHDYGKYARIDANIDIVDEPAMDVPSGRIAAPSNLATLEFSYMEGGNWLPGCHVSWTHPPDPRILSYRIEIATHDSRDYKLVGTTEQSSYDIKPAILPGTYDIRVRAEGTARGNWATITEVVFADPTVTPPGVTSLQVNGGGTTFSGRNCDLEWTFAFDPDVFPRARFRHYVVIIATDETVPVTKREVHSINNKHYTYTWELNKKDFVTPSRSFKVAVHVEDIYGNLSAATPVAFSNPAPSMVDQTPVLKNTIDGTSISWTALDDDDLKEYRIYMDTKATPDTLIAKVPAGNDHYTHVSTSVMNTAKNVMITPYDMWGAGTSSQVVVRTIFSPMGLDSSTTAGFFYIGTGNNCLKWQRLNIASIQPTGNGVIQLRTKIPYNDASLLNCCVQFDMQVEAEATDSLSQLRVFFSLAASGDPTNCYYMADGSYRPTIRLAKYTSSSVDYVAIVLGETSTQLKPIGYMVSALFSCATLPATITEWDGWSSYPSAATAGLTLLSALSERAGSGLADGSVTYAKIQDVSATDKILGRYSSGAGDVEEIACTAAGRAILDDATASDQRSTLGLGTMATAAATDYVAKALFDAQTILAATSDNTPAALTVAEQTLVGRITGGNIAALSASQVRTLINVADGATANTKASGTEVDAGSNDTKFVTPAAIYNSHNVPSVAPGTSGNLMTSDGTYWTSVAPSFVAKSLYDANSVLCATSDNTPAALTIGEQTVLGRVTGGVIAALAIDSDLASVSANHDTLPSAKATKAYADLMLPLAGGAVTGQTTFEKTWSAQATMASLVKSSPVDHGPNTAAINAFEADLTGVDGSSNVIYGRGGYVDLGIDYSLILNLRAASDTGANGVTIRAHRHKGTLAEPTTLASGNDILRVSGYGQYDSTVGNESEAGYMILEASEAWSSTAKGSRWSFYNIPAGGTTLTKWLESTGDKIGFFAATPVVKAAHIANPTDLATCQSSIASILTALENYGLLATS